MPTGGDHEDPAHCRAEHARELAGEATQRVALREELGRDQLGNDGTDRRHEEGRGRSERRELDVEKLHPELPGDAEDADRCRDDAAGEVGDQDDPAPRQAIDDRAAEQQQTDLDGGEEGEANAPVGEH